MFTGSYTLEYTTSALNSFAITDTSDYTDEPQDDFVTRRVYFQLIDGSFWQDPDGNDYWDFGFDDYPDDYITFDFLASLGIDRSDMHPFIANPGYDRTPATADGRSFVFKIDEMA